MKSKKVFYPKIVFPTINLLFSIATFTMLIFTILNLAELFNESNSGESLFSAVIFILIIGYFTFHLAYFFCYYFKYIVLDGKIFSIFELIKLKITKVEFDKIRGYSKSEVNFGRYNWKSRSIVIYYKNGKTSEIVKVFVHNIDIIEKELKNKKVKYLGFEDYSTGWFYREYRFKNQ
ncbi:MAG: hypothetical protein ACOH1O_02680 [Flavobacterium sp.]